LTKSAHDLEKAGGVCVAAEAAAVAVGVVFSGEGTLLSLEANDAPADQIACLTNVAKKINFPRFAGASFHLNAMVMPMPKARSRTRAARPQR
jgi:hypothetical protein